MLSCPEKLELQNLLTGKIDPSRQIEVDAHIESCETCQSTLDDLTDESTLDVPGLAKRSIRTVRDDPVSRLVSRLQESPPMEALSDETTQRIDEVVEFPGEPTDEAPMGVLGPYNIREQIGGGATGLVYRAIDSRLDRPVAIKVLRGSLAVSTSARARLEREARAAASLNHDHIVTLFGIENRADFPPYLVMEFVDGTPLSERLKRETRLPPVEAAHIVRQIALALAAADDQGLVHRDVKPSNILLDRRLG